MPESPVPPSTELLPPDLRRLRRTTDLLDRAIRIPGTGIAVGLDALIGLVPGAGDVVGALMGASVILSALRHRVPLPVVMRMVLNTLIDMGIGSVPVVGDVLDVLYKNNVKNLDLLLAHRDATQAPRPLPAIVRTAVLAAAIVVGSVGLLLTWGVLELIGLVVGLL